MFNLLEHVRNYSQSYEFVRFKVGRIQWPEVQLREKLLQRKNLIPGRIKLLKGGGTIFSEVDEFGIRTGKSMDPSDTLDQYFSSYKKFIDKKEVEIYDGLSEDLNIHKLDQIEVKVAKAINKSRNINTFVLFCGSDMTEEIGNYLHGSLAGELYEQNIRLFLVWANDPVSVQGTDAIKHLERAFQAAHEDYNGGIYIISENEVIPAEFAQKETWHREHMKYFNIKDDHALAQEKNRRRNNFDLANRLSAHFFSPNILSFADLISQKDPEKLQYQFKEMKSGRHSGGKDFGLYYIDSYVDGSSRRYKDNLSINILASDPHIHPYDASGKVIVKNINITTPVPTYEDFKDAEAVLFILNHSATTNIEIARAIRDICAKRFFEGKPLATFAVTETGEPRKWEEEFGIYPSAEILRDWVTLIPGHIKPTIVKLWAGIHELGMTFGQELNGFMLTNYLGEVEEDFLTHETSQTIYNYAWNI